jgi:hypothetical protein
LIQDCIRSWINLSVTKQTANCWWTFLAVDPIVHIVRAAARRGEGAAVLADALGIGTVHEVAFAERVLAAERGDARHAFDHKVVRDGERAPPAVVEALGLGAVGEELLRLDL